LNDLKATTVLHIKETYKLEVGKIMCKKILSNQLPKSFDTYFTYTSTRHHCNAWPKKKLFLWRTLTTKLKTNHS